MSGWKGGRMDGWVNVKLFLNSLILSGEKKMSVETVKL